MFQNIIQKPHIPLPFIKDICGFCINHFQNVIILFYNTFFSKQNKLVYIGVR